MWTTLIFWLCCFFFFQAEDGIRDLTVTGVQTCALPIWSCGNLSRQQQARRFIGQHVQLQLQAFAERACSRSEERRVGKSVDLGGRRIIKKKKTKTKERIEN